MAIMRDTVYCEYCGKPIDWIPTKMTEYERVMKFVGDRGGHYDYENHYKKCRKYKKTMKKLDKKINNAKTEFERNKIMIEHVEKILGKNK